MKTLEGLRAPKIDDDNLHLACIKGALEFLNIDVSASWLAGGTGHAFVIRITPGVCLGDVDSSLQYAHDNGEMTRLCRNLGFELTHRKASTPDEVESAWQELRQALDSGHPCYTYYNFCNQMIGGYDEDGFYFAEDSYPYANQGQGPISVLEQERFGFSTVGPGQGTATDVATVKEGLALALAHREVDPENHGLAAYDNWSEAIRTQESTGTWRSIRAWATCRALGVDFLAEAKERLGGDLGGLFDEAREHYQVVADNLGAINQRCQAHNTQEVEPIDREGTAAQLSMAREAEAKGMEVLERIVAAL